MNPVTPSYGWFRWKTGNEKSDPVPSSRWLNHTNICSTGRDSLIIKIFLFLDRPSSLQSFWLPLLMSFLFWMSWERRQEISTSFNFLFFEYTFSASSLFKKLTIVLSVFPSLWQATIRNSSRSTPISWKRRSMKFSRSFDATELGMPEKSKHSLLDYCSNLWCFLSCSTSLLLAAFKASCKMFEAFCATETWLVNSSFFFTSNQFWTLFPITFSICPCFVVTNHFVEGLYYLVMPRKMLLNSHCSFYPTVL